MHRTALACVTALAALLACTTATAADVFMTRDAQGRPIYTDRPESLPAAKVNVVTKQTDVVEAQTRYQEQMAKYQAADQVATEAAKKTTEERKAAELTAADRAKRCTDARANYQNLMNAHQIYAKGDKPDERRYLDSAEIDASRANAKKAMDDLCAGL